jgi:hypothetical protein
MKRSILLITFTAACGAGKGDGETPPSNDVLLQNTLESINDGFDSAEAENGEDGSPTMQEESSGLTLGCLTITTDPSPLPQPLPESFNVSWSFDNCRIWGGRQWGTHSIDTTRSDDGRVRDFVTARDITRNYGLGGQADIDTSSTLHAEGLRSEGSIARTLDLEEHRVRMGPGGNVWWDVNVTLSSVHAIDTFDPETSRLSTRVVDGSATLGANRAGWSVTAVAADLLREPAVCCYPTGGTITLSAGNDETSLEGRTYAFSETCGSVTADDGEVLELIACRP